MHNHSDDGENSRRIMRRVTQTHEERSMQNSLKLLGLLPALVLIGCGGGAPKPAATADAAMTQVVEGLQNNKPEVAWNALPASYQEDVNGLAHQLAGKIPAELHNGVAGLATKLEDVLKTKKDLLLANPQISGAPVDVAGNYDSLVSILGILNNSDLMDNAKLKSSDVGDILSTTVADLMKEASSVTIDDKMAPPGMGELTEVTEKLKSFKAELVSEEGDKAVVRMTAEGESPKEEEFVKVEGKWIPAEMAEEWDGMIAEAKKAIDEINITPEQSAQVQMGLSMAGGVLDQLKAANSAEELNQVLGGVMGMVMGGM